MAGTKQTTGPQVSDLKALCYAMSTSGGFELNTKALAPFLGIAVPSNVPRKIKTIIEPLGFELKNNKITAKEGDDIPGGDDKSAADPAPPVKISRRRRAAKKRKLEREAAEENDAEKAEADDADNQGHEV
ncbi:hypothetical protein PG994_007265 [Apiospora phragmitis]|uniref:Uncharacterized protein n=1 Tax=Apiospora phragmitis TaxID=2905665 RepID=A0ABR1V130_9PEZI